VGNEALLAICYDFDGTLSPGNMQEYDFFRGLGVTPSEFWREATEMAKAGMADPVLAYMKLMLDKAGRTQGMDISKEAFRRYGASVQLYEGLDGWFDRINAYAESRGLRAEHYIISSGIREMIKGSSISDRFKEVFASSFLYDKDGYPIWPAMAVNYTNKTQYLFRINKGVSDITDNREVNRHVPHEQRRIPFDRMVYIGDGDTDIPCMKLVKDKGGFSVAVFGRQDARKAAEACELLSQGRVNAAAPADYREGSYLEEVIRAFIDHAAADHRLKELVEKVMCLQGA